MDATPSESMPRRERPTACGRPDLAARLASGEEISGGFETEITAHAQTCAACSLRLSLVLQAERWLADQSSSNRGLTLVSTPCPTAEELYDYGGGPGARRVPVGVERKIDAHLVECEPCRGLVATLAVRPPAPLLDRGVIAPAAEAPAPAETPRLAPVRRPSFRRPALQLAAAAAVVVAGVLWWNSTHSTRGAESTVAQAPTSIVYPKPQVLRGESSDALHYPRAHVLAALPEGVAGTWHSLRFVIAPQSNVEGYRVKLYRLPASAFGEGELVDDITSTEPEFEWSNAAARTLAPGRYAWESWSINRGLESPLGRRDFQVVTDSEARKALTELGRLSEPERSSKTLAWLVDHEYRTDARAYALALPPTQARDDFLNAIPAR